MKVSPRATGPGDSRRCLPVRNVRPSRPPRGGSDGDGAEGLARWSVSLRRPHRPDGSKRELRRRGRGVLSTRRAPHRSGAEDRATDRPGPRRRSSRTKGRHPCVGKRLAPRAPDHSIAKRPSRAAIPETTGACPPRSMPRHRARTNLRSAVSARARGPVRCERDWPASSPVRRRIPVPRSGDDRCEGASWSLPEHGTAPPCEGSGCFGS